VTVSVRTANGSAGLSDYTAYSQRLTFAPLETSKQVQVQVTADTLVEADETFRVLLSSPVNATIADGEGMGTIVDDDAAGLSAGSTSEAQGSASASASSITLDFSGNAPAGAFTISVNGTEVSAQSVERDGSTVTLLLPDGSLRTGDTVAVTWQGGSINLLAE
jgi:hypothetical protein